MEVYTLDDNLRRTQVIDRFESLIWTERFSAYGDFQLVIHSTLESRNLLVEGTYLAINGSTRVMKIENSETKDDSEGRSMLTVSGRSLESILTERVAYHVTTGLVDPTWALTGTPGDIARQIFYDTCIDNVNVPADEIPFYTPGSLYPADTIAESDVVIAVEFGHDTVYNVMKELCDIYNLGFRLVRNQDASELYFNVYSGSDRTTTQTTLAPVVFSPDLENLTNMTEFVSIEEFKNTAYVMGPTGTMVTVYAEGFSSSEGLDRSVILVDGSGVTETTEPELTNALTRLGKDALAQNKNIRALDGELPQSSTYRYGVDYNLGDLIEMRNDEGVTNRMRVTEQIFVDDAEGERSYPTLAVDLFITPGSWYAWDYNQVWDDATETWDEA